MVSHWLFMARITLLRWRYVVADKTSAWRLQFWLWLMALADKRANQIAITRYLNGMEDERLEAADRYDYERER